MKNVVASINDKRILVEEVGISDTTMLLNFPDARKIKVNTWEIPRPNTPKKLGSYLTNLNALGFVFEDGQGWEPAQIFLYLRDSGNAKGEIKTIIHKSNQQLEIATK